MYSEFSLARILVMQALYPDTVVPLNPVVSGLFSFESSSSILKNALEVPLELVIDSLEEVGTGSLEELVGLLPAWGMVMSGALAESLPQAVHRNAVDEMNRFPKILRTLLFIL